MAKFNTISFRLSPIGAILLTNITSSNADAAENVRFKFDTIRNSPMCYWRLSFLEKQEDFIEMLFTITKQAFESFPLENMPESWAEEGIGMGFFLINNETPHLPATKIIRVQNPFRYPALRGQGDVEIHSTHESHRPFKPYRDYECGDIISVKGKNVVIDDVTPAKNGQITILDWWGATHTINLVEINPPIFK
jgi:hypothetical protein